MKKDELKRDPVAEKLLSAVEYIKNNNTKTQEESSMLKNIFSI